MAQWRNSNIRFGWIGRILHWSGVALFIAIYVGISGLDLPPKIYQRDSVVDTHIWIGLGFFLLIAARLGWRLISINPVRGWRLNPRQEKFVVGLHQSLYLVVFLVSISGILSIGITPPGVSLLDVDGLKLTRSVHNMLALGFLCLVAIHAFMALVNLISAPPTE